MEDSGFGVCGVHLPWNNRKVGSQCVAGLYRVRQNGGDFLLNNTCDTFYVSHSFNVSVCGKHNVQSCFLIQTLKAHYYCDCVIIVNG